MLIKFTNAHPQHLDKPILINSDTIVSVRQGPVVREDSTVNDVTFVFCPPHGTWEVKETIDDILKMISKTKATK